jgi:hypothetical protein
MAQDFFTETNGPRTGNCQVEIFSIPDTHLISVIAGGSDFLYDIVNGPLN